MVFFLNVKNIFNCLKAITGWGMYNPRFLPNFSLQTVIMQRKKSDVDVINDVLVLTMAAYPESEFVRSLHRQYHNWGGLSKKQLEGLYQKALKAGNVPQGKLATVEAEILKKPTRFKSSLPEPAPLYKKDSRIGKLISEILEKYPEHKKVLFLRLKYDNNELLSPAEVTELERFHKILRKPV
jgi:hypothetical protein